MSKNVLVIAAHPDDEVLGCGGTIAKHIEGGDSVHVLIVAEGATSRRDCRDIELVSQELKELRQDSLRANAALGVHNLSFLGLPDNRLDSIDRLDIIKQIENVIAGIDPHTVYVHHAGDLNIDHRIVHECTLTACRPLPGRTIRKILSYEVLSSTEWQVPGSSPAFVPNYFVAIEAQWERKIESMKCYVSEIREWPHPRSIEAIEALASVRGSSIGSSKAEAFMTIREIKT